LPAYISQESKYIKVLSIRKRRLKMHTSGLKQNAYPNYAIVDSDFLVYKIGFATADAPEAAAKARLTEWLENFLFINLKVDDYECHITGKTNFRNNIAVTAPYKGNRVNLAKPVHYQALRDHLVKRHGAAISVDEEADDVVAIESTKRLNQCWIVGQDKDLDQLEGWHYNPVKDEKYYISAFDGLKNFYKQMLTGDRTDNIVGVKGVGPVKANKLLMDCKTEQEMYEVICKVYADNGIKSTRILENGNLLWLRRSVMESWCPPSCSQEQSGMSTK
jgi:hypothetical protein